MLTTSSPVPSHPRRLVAAHEMSNVLQFDIIRSSSGRWASPLNTNAKKDRGDWRRYRNCIFVTAFTVHDSNSVRLIQNSIVNLGFTSAFSQMDFDKAYHQIPVEHGDISKVVIILRNFLVYKDTSCPSQRGSGVKAFYAETTSGLPFMSRYCNDLLVACASWKNRGCSPQTIASEQVHVPSGRVSESWIV